ncbi:BolA family morphoprotein [Wigglesworthia glossinidia endosymbiont of Glossina morsitans morsitans (Yale colony)]|uniref:BolA family morphoprotein n=1 Tax=Wigglesworthia glossinidia endosymbiont of Glossina morsitans morsitans (Yale colony) TaxID=1142511 RepID=H6Q5F6_WIGGL|nr:BolA family protein [Wigglesworthia glossinidia]AFA41439.1 BolA family morphoprotein [Wigglesworthia glossinidia endosymbiont of Glossina morsitans morsitans (Yale colony)]
MKKIIKKKLNAILSPTFLYIQNESYKHKNSKNAYTHFSITIVCKKFKNKSQLIRHQLIYQILSRELRHDIHALSLHTYCDVEWKINNRCISSTPICYNLN